MQEFGQLKISPPLKPEDLDEKIEQLNKLKSEYIETGEEKLKEEMEKESEGEEEEDYEEYDRR